ncbi:MAG: NUDIX hydrolase [Bacilli bacterium]|nr:NUDIX hydrolase [Bacilli bacterium]
MSLRNTIENYIPSDEQEERDQKQMLTFIDSFEDVLTRDNTIGHFSASAFVINKDKNKMAAVYHIITDGWTYPGGHADGEEDLLSVALREVEEETGLKAKVLNDEPYLLSTNPVGAHIKRGKFVSPHLHFDALYLMEADDKEKLEYREDESKGVKWIPFDEVDNEKMVDFIRNNVKKLIKRI